MARGKRKKGRSAAAGGKNTLALLADRHDLYQKSVQAPEADIEFFGRIFEKHRGRRARDLREDFCGTAYLAREWVRSHPKRRAFGVDLDLPTLAWSHRAAAGLERKQRRRLSLVCADVLEVAGPPVDVVCALNFSFCVFKTRALLGRYFEVAHRTLAPDGVFFCELYGGTEALVELQEERDVEDFHFIWDQASYNPISHETLCHIHFEMADGSRLERAFTYDWRLWTVPEVRELLAEAGFRRSRVYWEQVDDEGDGTGEYLATEQEENQEGWLVYIVAFK